MKYIIRLIYFGERQNDKEKRGSKSIDTAMKLYENDYNLFVDLTWAKKE